MFSDFKFIILWWLVSLILSSLSWPLIFSLFRNFWDRGYAFAKITSLSVLTYVIFVAGVFRLMPFTRGSLVILMAAALGLNYFYLARNKFAKWNILVKVLKDHHRSFIFEELLFLTVLLSWSYVRGFAPDIEGLEKFMDWGFVNSALRSQYMPPVDMWFAPEPINYYYFGHLMTAVLTRLSTIPSTVTYNLAIATICALTFVSGFSLASNLVHLSFTKLKKKVVSLWPKVVIAGLLSALILTFGGNLHAVYKIARNNIEKNGRLILTREAMAKASQSYWYPDATRFIGFDPDTNDKTIHEFPSYSFVVADLHGHMNDIPVVLLFMAFILSLYASRLSSPNPVKPGFILSLASADWPLVLVSGFLLSVAYMTNAWDFAVYGLVFAVFSFFSQLSKGLPAALRHTFTNGILVIGLWYIFTLPFSLNFIPMTEGLRWSDSRTPIYQLFVLYGGFWLITLPFAFYVIYRLLAARFLHRNRLALSVSDLFVLALITVATLLIFIPEIGYIKDIYIYEHRRANTMFKLVYQAFMMYSLVAGYVLTRLSLTRGKLLPLYRLVFLAVFAAHMVYPYFAVKSYYTLTSYRGLEGLNWLKTRYPDSYNAVTWLNDNIEGQPIIVEAVGDSYTDYNHVSMSTGLPTIEGWVVHEWLWRGGYDQPGARSMEVQTVYESDKAEDVRPILQKYNVSYIFIGDKENEKYPQLKEKKFQELGTIVYQSGNTKIYKLNK